MEKYILLMILLLMIMTNQEKLWSVIKQILEGFLKLEDHINLDSHLDNEILKLQELFDSNIKIT